MSRILVAEDDLVQLRLRKMALELAGHEVMVAVDAPGALRCLDLNRPDILLMDLKLPNAEGEPDSGEGMALIRRIRELGCSTPVVVVSGWPEQIYGEPEERMVSRVMVKPVTTRELLQAIAELVG